MGPKFWTAYSMHCSATAASPSTTAIAAGASQPAEPAFMRRPATIASSALITMQAMNAAPRPWLGCTCAGRHMWFWLSERR